MVMDVETYMAGVKAKTGFHYLEIVEQLKAEGFTKNGTSATMVKNYLKEKYDIGHGHAMGIWRFLKPSVEE
jgi:Domain of unknown function (DUF4287)